MKKGCIHLVMLRYAMQKYTAKLNLNPRKQYDLIEKKERERKVRSSCGAAAGTKEVEVRYIKDICLVMGLSHL